MSEDLNDPISVLARRSTRLGAIQSHGALVVIFPDDLRSLHLNANAIWR